MYADAAKRDFLCCKGTNDHFISSNFSLLSKLRALSRHTEKLILSVKF